MLWFCRATRRRSTGPGNCEQLVFCGRSCLVASLAGVKRTPLMARATTTSTKQKLLKKLRRYRRAGTRFCRVLVKNAAATLALPQLASFRIVPPNGQYRCEAERTCLKFLCQRAIRVKMINRSCACWVYPIYRHVNCCCGVWLVLLFSVVLYFSYPTEPCFVLCPVDSPHE